MPRHVFITQIRVFIEICSLFRSSLLSRKASISFNFLCFISLTFIAPFLFLLIHLFYFIWATEFWIVGAHVTSGILAISNFFFDSGPTFVFVFSIYSSLSRHHCFPCFPALSLQILSLLTTSGGWRLVRVARMYRWRTCVATAWLLGSWLVIVFHLVGNEVCFVFILMCFRVNLISLVLLVSIIRIRIRRQVLYHLLVKLVLQILLKLFRVHFEHLHAHSLVGFLLPVVH